MVPPRKANRELKGKRESLETKKVTRRIKVRARGEGNKRPRCAQFGVTGEVGRPRKRRRASCLEEIGNPVRSTKWSTGGTSHSKNNKGSYFVCRIGNEKEAKEPRKSYFSSSMG